MEEQNVVMTDYVIEEGTEANPKGNLLVATGIGAAFIVGGLLIRKAVKAVVAKVKSKKGCAEVSEKTADDNIDDSDSESDE